MEIIKRSAMTGNISSMDLDVTEEQLALWDSGQLVQDVFPKLTASEREFLISGCTPEEWADMFGSPFEEANSV